MPPGCPLFPRGLLLARIALAAGDHHAAREHLQALPAGELTPRRALVRQIMLAAAAIERGDPKTASLAELGATSRSQAIERAADLRLL